MKENPKAVGERSESAVLNRFIHKGYSVSIPFGNNQRYDLIVDRDGKLWKVQVKTGCFRNGCVSFRPCSTNGFTGQHKDYVGQIDAFAVYCPETKVCYWVPIDVCGSSMVCLRVDPPPCGGKQRNIRWAKEFQF